MVLTEQDMGSYSEEDKISEKEHGKLTNKEDGLQWIARKVIGRSSDRNGSGPPLWVQIWVGIEPSPNI
jgi:hypothetical protein